MTQKLCCPKVIYYDWDMRLIAEHSVPEGEDDIPPESPTRAHYTFKEWLGDYKKVTGIRRVIASYAANPSAEFIDTEDENS